MPDDVRLMAQLGIPAYRFSVAWPRVMPEGTGAVNDRGLDFYRRLVDRLLEHRITPVVTLFHWDLPQALGERGGWLARETIDAYVRYTEVVVRALGDRVPYWLTHNEPWCVGVLGYLLGIHAPGHRDLREALVAIHHLLVSHGRAVQAYRGSGARGAIGITLNLFHHEPETDSDADRRACVISDGYTNRWFLDALHGRGYPPDMVSLYEEKVGPLDFIRGDDLAVIAQTTDFLGVNYYARRMVRAEPTAVLGHRVVDEMAYLPLTGGGWGIYPAGLRAILLRLREDYGNPPVLITENGAIYEDTVGPDGKVHDPDRVAYLRDHIAAMGEAIAGGADVRGYFCWSLLDNLEWAEGYAKRFGVVYVDHATQQRIPKDSARFLAAVAAHNGLPRGAG
jgi:beta-glucosidase